jgi:UDP-N-acetylglucosamine--N-acetylmuramyl-(pentapeptide) pyrophosphoryl-undecaprenol N-acetylglucosamine transferase
MTPPLIALAAGGTGGHIFPSEALARAMLDRGVRVALVTDRRGQAFSLPEVQTYRIRASRLRRDMLDRLRAVVEMGLGGLEARRVLRDLRPAAVVGFGGYPSLPTILAASLAKIPIVLHEQNARLGRANRRLASRAKVIATSFESVAGLPQGARAVLTGNPVRPGIIAIRGRPYVPPGPGDRLQVLVVGGSQGARVFSEVVPEALALLAPAERARIDLVQQCRPEDIEAVRGRLAAIGAQAELSSFFSDMPERLAAAHLVISRSGASSVAELGVAGRPAILSPYPFATDDHQAANAEAYARNGAASVIAQRMLTPIALAERFSAILAAPAALAQAAAAAHRNGRPDAASRLAELVLSEIGAIRSPAPQEVAA